MAVQATHADFRVTKTGDLDIDPGCCRTITLQQKTAEIFVKGIKEPFIVDYVVEKQSSFLSGDRYQIQVPAFTFSTNWCYGPPAEYNCMEQLCHQIKKIYGEEFPCNHPYEPGCVFNKSR